MIQLELRILTSPYEIKIASVKLSKRQKQKLASHRDAVLAARPDGTIIVYRPTQK